MTGGRVVVLGVTGRNFAAGMSGGIAYVFDALGDFKTRRANTALVNFEEIDPGDEIELRELIDQHHACTGSTVAKRILDDWEASLRRFVKVMPSDYRRVLNEQAAQAGVLVEAS
jgi:glutamate synthase domain-containing protein 3